MRKFIIVCAAFLLAFSTMTPVALADDASLFRAEMHLARLRDGTSPRPPFDFYLLILNLKDGNLLPSDIGTSYQELQRIGEETYQNEAIIFLKKIRDGTSLSPVDDIEVVLRDLKIAGLKPEAIGTSDEELELLRVEAHRHMASLFLDRLHSGSDEPLVDLFWIDEYLRGGGLSYADVGTSGEELTALICGVQCVHQ